VQAMAFNPIERRAPGRHHSLTYPLGSLEPRCILNVYWHHGLPVPRAWNPQARDWVVRRKTWAEEEKC